MLLSIITLEKAGEGMCFEAMRMREVAKYIRKDEVLIIDLRDQDAYVKGHVPSAKNFPYDEKEEIKEWCAKLKTTIDLYEKRKSLTVEKVLIYCERGNVSLLIARDLNKGYGKVYNLYGGYAAYRGPVEKNYIG